MIGDERYIELLERIETHDVPKIIDVEQTPPELRMFLEDGGILPEGHVDNKISTFFRAMADAARSRRFIAVGFSGGSDATPLLTPEEAANLAAADAQIFSEGPLS